MACAARRRERGASEGRTGRAPRGDAAAAERAAPSDLVVVVADENGGARHAVHGRVAHIISVVGSGTRRRDPQVLGALCAVADEHVAHAHGHAAVGVGLRVPQAVGCVECEIHAPSVCDSVCSCEIPVESLPENLVGVARLGAVK